MTRRSFFWSAEPRRALIETGAIAVAGLLLLWSLGFGSQLSILRQGAFFLAPACALYSALRLRVPEGGWVQQMAAEGGLAAGVTLVLSPVQIVLLWTLFADGTLAPTPETIIVVIPFVALIPFLPAFEFGFFRLGVRVWLFWDRLRRRHLLWALTHAHLTVVVIIALGFVVLITIASTASGGASSLAPSVEGPAGAVATALILAVPYLGLLVILVGLMMVAVLPPSAILSYFFARRTTRRLEALAAAAEALRGGEYTARVPVTGEDEVARLQSDFNAMAADLERAMRELQVERDNVAALLQARRQLVANVSHELRTPVATLRGYLESVLARGDAVPQAELRRDLEVMERETRRLQQLIEDLFTLSRAEVGALEMRCEPIDVGALVRRVAETVAPLAWRTRRLEVVTEIPDDLPPARADETRLEQVLRNLVRNSTRHTPPGGIIALTAAAVPDGVTIEVRDTGEGIAPDDLPHIWERFYRADNGRAHDEGGAGLGLALVKELTEAMGGTVAVSSTPGEGSCFRVTLPRA